MFTAPQISDFKAQFFRDFNFGTDQNNCVLDQDITNAFTPANVSINQDLWCDQTSYTYGYCLLAAHYMVLALRSSSQGLNGQYNWAQNTKAAGPVSEGFQIPQRVIDNPELMMLTKTNYGALYLQLILPELCGQIFTVYGRTKP